MIIISGVFFIFQTSFSQTISETLDYINGKLNLDTAKFSVACNWEVSKSSELFIKRYYIGKESWVVSTYLKQLDYGIRVYPDTSDDCWKIRIFCKGDSACFTNNLFRSETFSSIVVQAGISSGNKEDTRKLGNAICHLIWLAHRTTSYLENKYDPFDY